MSGTLERDLCSLPLFLAMALGVSLLAGGCEEEPDIERVPFRCSHYNQCAEQHTCYDQVCIPIASLPHADTRQTTCARDDHCTGANSDICHEWSCVQPQGYCAEVLRADYCFVDGTCFVHGAQVGSDKCMKCDSWESTTAGRRKSCGEGFECDPDTGSCEPLWR